MACGHAAAICPPAGGPGQSCCHESLLQWWQPPPAVFPSAALTGPLCVGGGKVGVLRGSFLSAWFCFWPGSRDCWEVEVVQDGLNHLPGWPPLLPQPLPSLGSTALCLPAGAVSGQAFNDHEHPYLDILWVLGLIVACESVGVCWTTKGIEAREATRHF